jgi:hypothetical protein
VVGGGGEDASAVEVDVEDSYSIMVARLKIVNRRHVLQHTCKLNRKKRDNPPRKG